MSSCRVETRSRGKKTAQMNLPEIEVLVQALAKQSYQLNLEDSEREKLLIILLRKLTLRRKKPMATKECRVVVGKALAG